MAEITTTEDLDVLSELKELWDASSAIANLQENRWAKNEKLVRSQHLTARKAGQSNLFVPKIESIHYRKRADHLFALTGDNPVSLKKTLSSTKTGAKIMERVVNYYLTESGGINWQTAVQNGSSNALTYNFAPWFIDWDRGVTEVEQEVEKLDEEGNIVVETVSIEQETFSYPTLEIIPPEDFRIDPSVGWDEIGMARYGIIRRWRDKSYAKRMADIGRWPEISEDMFTQNMESGAGNTLKVERAHQNSPFSNFVDIDNGLIEVWYAYYWTEIDGEYKAVSAVSIEDTMLLEEPTELEFNLANMDGNDPWPFGVGRIYTTPHEMYDRALPEKLESGQIEVNAIRNQRRDNVSLVLNREKYMTPEAGIDPAVLSRSFAGKVNVVKSANSVWWDAPPDVTASSYNEESSATNDMERLVAESAQRMGGEGKSSTTATEVKISSANASASSTLDASTFNVTFAEPIVNKLVRMIRLAAAPSVFEAAAMDIKAMSPDPYQEALTGDFSITVGAGAMQAARDLALSNAANLAAIIQSVYGPNANYHPILKQAIEMQGINIDEVIADPRQGPQPSDLANSDLGGMAGQDNLTVQPNVQMSGGQFGSTPSNGAT